MDYRPLIIQIDVNGIFATHADIKYYDTIQKIVVCDLLVENEDGYTVLATDRYFFYFGENKNIPFGILPGDLN